MRLSDLDPDTLADLRREFPRERRGTCRECWGTTRNGRCENVRCPEYDEPDEDADSIDCYP